MTGIAAALTGMRFAGMEMNPRRLAVAAERIRRAAKRRDRELRRRIEMAEDEHVALARAFVAGHHWTFAVTCAETAPHWYVRRADMGAEDFERFVRLIRERGTGRKFGGRMYTYLDLDGFTHWTMGNPVDETTIINRAVIAPVR